MSALDFFGIGDNRIAVWQFVNTSTIGAFIPDISGTLGVLTDGHTTYSPPPPSAQPQIQTGPTTANGNPLGDFLVFAGLCPGAICGNPGPIDSGDDRMRDTTMTTLANGSRVMWGGLGTADGFGGAGIMLFGVNLGSSISTTSLARIWGIHNPTNDLQFPAVGDLRQRARARGVLRERAGIASVGRVLRVLDDDGTRCHPDREPGYG